MKDYRGDELHGDKLKEVHNAESETFAVNTLNCYLAMQKVLNYLSTRSKRDIHANETEQGG